MATTRGREVLRGKLYYKAKKGNAKKRVVAAFCGNSPEGGKFFSAQIQIFDDYEKIEKPGCKPKGAIKLDNAKIESSYSTPPGSSNNSPAYASTILSSQGGINLSSSPLLSVGSTSSQSGSIPSASGSSELVYIFTVATGSEIHEFRTDSENDRLRWVKLLQLLVMYPHSQIPEEPKVNPIKDSFRQALEAKQYKADSVWPVYILPEEVGHKCGIIGQHILALRSGIPNVTMGQLDIISPTDHSRPVVTWDRDKMRRTGKTGHLVFIEIGRRCEGGPGLVWMYTGYQNDAQALRETLHRFLFQGDGSAVAMTQPQSLYDVPRSSFDSLPPSFPKRGSTPSTNYQNHLLNRSKSQDHDSGYHSVERTPSVLERTPPALDGPPVRLDKHPSIRRKRDSEVSVRSNSIVSSPYGSYGDDLFDCEEGLVLGAADSPPDDSEGYVTGPMDGDTDSIPPNQRHYDVVMPAGRSNSHPHYIAQAPEKDEYMRMVSPASTKEGQYVYMRSASFGSESKSPTIPVPMPRASGNVSTDEYDTLQHFPHNQRPSSRQIAGSLNYETLPTIDESRRVPIPVHCKDENEEGPSNYENHPLPQDLKGITPRVYRPNYENRDSALFRGRRGSHGQESYENVGNEHQHSPHGVMVTGTNTNGNNNVGTRRPSLRRRSSEKEEVSLFNSHSPPLSNSSEQPRQAVIVGH